MVIHAAPHWQRVDFVSDLHLHSGLPKTTQAFLNYLTQGVNGQRPDALFLLGDVFEVWVGDDVLEFSRADPDPEHGFLQHCAAALRQATQTTTLHWMAGNRDFLLGAAACQAMGMRALPDPTALVLGAHTLLLSHGDAGCTSDTAYQTFRSEVRSATWQQRFLQQPLAQRWAQARAIRAQSAAGKQAAAVWSDVDSAWADAQLQRHGASTLLHGHTHRPATHTLPSGCQRWVLSDWDLDHPGPGRAEVLRWHQGDWQRLPLAAA